MKFQGETLNGFDVEKFVLNIFGNTQHQKRVKSIANAALGVISSGSLIIHRIGRGLASAMNLIDKHAIKQVDRLLSNGKLNVWNEFSNWVPFLIGGRREIKVAMDWTDFDADNQATISINLLTSHGRATPLIWKSVKKSRLKNNRNNFEDELLYRLKELIPDGIKVTIIADRGFCDVKLMEYLKEELNFDYIIRIRGNIIVTDKLGETRKAKDWIGKSGRTKTYRAGTITGNKFSVETIVCTQAKAMKDPWCIVSSDKNLSGSGIVKWYAKRWGCEPQFRDIKDMYFGMGLSSTHIKNVDRRDRILFIHAIATAILTLLGAAGESIGLDKYLKANTAKKRTLSLFRQGCILFNRLPRMCRETQEKLLDALHKQIEENKYLTEILGVI